VASNRTNGPHSKRTRRPTATTPEARENQIISMAFDEAERVISEGNASSQLLTHFVKLGSTRERLEQEYLTQRIELERMKAEVLASEKRSEALMQEALSAFREYSGNAPIEDEEPYD
jgi:hypothetical protein